jgi:hypothetical protein
VTTPLLELVEAVDQAAEWDCPACGASIRAAGGMPDALAIERYCLACQRRAASAGTNLITLALARGIGHFLAAWDADAHIVAEALSDPGRPLLEEVGRLRRIHDAWQRRHQ